MKVIFIALAMLILPAPVMAQETGMLVAQAGDNRPATRGDFYRLDGKMDRAGTRGLTSWARGLTGWTRKLRKRGAT